MKRRPLRIAATLAAVGLAACSPEIERVPEPYLPTSAHDAYGHGLRESPLAETALAQDWLAAARSALQEPVPVSTPYREVGWFEQGAAEAVGYRFTVVGGQRVEIDVEIDSPRPLRLFLDLFRTVDEAGRAPVHVASAPQGSRRVEFEPRRQATYILRVQPELLRNGRFTVTVRSVPQLAFPVEGHGMSDIWSPFGAPREGGRRSHHGVDIFAPRGTPVLAAADGIVTRANETPVGGNVVWMTDPRRNLRIYYAHMDRSVVERRQRVEAGDVIGYVGNTGNARTTPPHLHFGVYARGPTDPHPFLVRLEGDPAELAIDQELLGAWGRISEDDVTLWMSPERDDAAVQAVPRHTPLQVRGGSSRWYRVRLPDGRSGYLASGQVEPVDDPIRHTDLGAPVTLLHSPQAGAVPVDEVEPGTRLPVLGTYGPWIWVQGPRGRTGWLNSED